MGGSKPPQSKAQKRKAKMLTKLDPHRAKQFKAKNKRVKEEHEIWEAISQQKGNVGGDDVTSKLAINPLVVNTAVSKPVIKLVQVAIPVGKKGETARQRKARMREYVFGD